jgi:hypothetical protein
MKRSIVFCTTMTAKRVGIESSSSTTDGWNLEQQGIAATASYRVQYYLFCFIVRTTIIEIGGKEKSVDSSRKMKGTRDNKRVSISLLAVLTIVFLQNCLTTKAFVPTQVRQAAQNYLRQAIEDENEEPLPSSSVSSEGIAFSPGEATLRLGLSSAPTVWTEFGRIAEEYEPINLGQGFPDWLPPKFAIDSLVEAVLDSAQSPHQYTRPAGHPNLVQQLARRYSVHMKQEIKPMEEVAVTVGASQALYLSLQTLIKPGKCSIYGHACFFDPAKIDHV